jgi:hypothetical protein
MNSAACRDEAEKFLERVEREPERRTRLVLPILLIDVPDLRRRSTDLLKAKLSGYQWTDMREHAASAPDDPALKRLLWSMAATLNERVLEADPPSVEVEVASDGGDDELDLAEIMVAMAEVEADGGSIAGHLIEVTDALTSFFDVLGPSADPQAVRRAAEQAAAQVEAPLSEAEEAMARVATVVRQLDVFIREMAAAAGVGAISPQDLIDLAERFEATDVDLGDMDQVRQVMRLVGFTSRSLRPPMRRLDAVMVGFGDIMRRFEAWAPALRVAAEEASS